MKENSKINIIKLIIIGAGIISALILLLFNKKKEIIPVASKIKNKYEILVDVEESKLYLINNLKIEKTYSCSGGKWSTPSPIGTWKIIQKATWGEGFGGHWLRLNVPWGKFGIHGTLDPTSVGWASSHGCIRMKNEEVEELYKIIPYGTKVTIINGPYGSFGTGFRNLKSGMYGADVLEIQKLLKKLGYFNGAPNRKIWRRNRKSSKSILQSKQFI